jgi:two-component system cell cycle response regulator DivK
MGFSVRVLVVEDTEDTRELFRSMLKSLGHEVFEADNGKRGVEIALKEKPDLILMDLRMPAVDGLLGAGALRMIDGFQAVPIIAVTANYSKRTRDDAILAGCNECIGKPLTRDDLEELIDRYA